MRSSRSIWNSGLMANSSDKYPNNDSLDSSYFKDLSNLMNNANDSSFFVHVDEDNAEIAKDTLVEDTSKIAFDWDAVDSGMCKKPVDKFESFTGIPRPTRQDGSVDESQFVSLNSEEARRMFDKDGEDRLRLNSSTTASFSIPTESNNPFDQSATGGDETMGGYFYKKSSYPAETKQNPEGQEMLPKFNVHIPLTSKDIPSSCSSTRKESDYWSDNNLRQYHNVNQNEDRIISAAHREDIALQEFQDRRPSIARFSSFFRSSRSDGLDKEDIINHVLKYCKTQKSESDDTFEQQRDAHNLEDSFSQSLEHDMSGIIRTSQYTLNHSTPKKSTQNLSEFSLKTMCGTATSLDRDILPRLSQLPEEISRSISKSFKHEARPDSLRRYTQSTSQSIKIRSGSKQLLTDSIVNAVGSRPETSRQFPTRNSRTESAPSRRGTSSERSLANPTSHSVSINTSFQSTATSGCSSSCSTQTVPNQVVPPGPFPMFGYPIIVQVQCPHHQAPQQHGQCNSNSMQHACSRSQSAPQFQPWMPMMSMPYPQYPQPTMQPVQNCANCQCSSNSNTATTAPILVNDQTLAIESSPKTQAKEVEEFQFVPPPVPSRGPPKINIDKPIIRWGPTETHVGEYTSVTIVNQSDSTLFLRCGVIQNSESKHFKIVSETYDRKIQGITLECEIPVADIKVISLVFTPEKEKRYLGELHIKCRYLDHSPHDGIYSCKLPLVGTGIKSSHR